MRVVIDSGHGQYDNVYPDKAHFEGTQMYKLGRFLISDLCKYGWTVVTTRQALGDNPDVEQRGKMAQGANLFISLHSNVCNTPTVDRVVVIPNIGNKETKFRTFCQNIGDAVKECLSCEGKTQIYDRTLPGDATKNYYGVLRNAVLAGCTKCLIVEHSFHSNPSKASLLCNDDILKGIADAEAKILYNYLEPFPKDDPVPVVPSYWGHKGTEYVTYQELERILKG